LPAEDNSISIDTSVQVYGSIFVSRRCEMITRKQKEAKVKEIAQDMKNANLILLTDYRGLNVTDITRMRRDIRDTGFKYKVVKNKLSIIAAREAGLEALESYFEGPVAMAFSDIDPVETTKIMLKWVKELDHLSIKVGLLDGRVLDVKEVEALGAIPSGEVLLAMVCGAFQAPILGLVTVLQGNISKLVFTLESIRQQKEIS
jgi:large subunit ribosomal protein L10